MSNQQTPLERLIAEKERILSACERQGHKLDEDFTYIQDHAGNLLLSGLSSFLFPGKKSSAKTGVSTAMPMVPGSSSVSMGISDVLSILKGMIPIAWEVVQPMLMAWGIKKAEKWIYNRLFKKKR